MEKDWEWIVYIRHRRLVQEKNCGWEHAHWEGIIMRNGKGFGKYVNLQYKTSRLRDLTVAFLSSDRIITNVEQQS